VVGGALNPLHTINGECAPCARTATAFVSGFQFLVKQIYGTGMMARDDGKTEDTPALLLPPHCSNIVRVASI
jgi:hypothetical protein